MTQPTAPTLPTAGFVQDLDVHVRARYPLLWLVTSEEQRIDGIVDKLARGHGKSYYTWSVTTGLCRVTAGKPERPQKKADPMEVLDAIEQLNVPAVVALKDFHPWLTEPAIVRRLRELAFHLKGTYKTVCLVSPTLALPPELEKEITVIDVPLPTTRELLDLLKEIVGVVRQGGRVAVELQREHAFQLVQAARGLTLAEAENAFAKAVAFDQKLSLSDLQLILDEKKQVIRKNGLLEYFSEQGDLGQVGGYEELKSWLARRQNAFTDAARRFGLPEPKGLLMLGVQGCGKSLTAKAVASTWGLPLLRLDMGRIFSGLVGSSEENMRKAIKVAESVAPVVLWIDEIEKGLSGLSSSGNTDGGVTSRVFGHFLTWLQEKTAPVFVVATANKIDALPPELLRKGRFDEIFFVDLPQTAERAQIFAIHLRRRGRDPAAFDAQRLAQLSQGFSGAEIEQAIVAGLYEAFAEGRDLAQAHVERALGETMPLSVTLREEIAKLRAWAQDRTRPASRPEGNQAVAQVVAP
ncbi:AAA family ATPase [Vulgatibacter sp.]|uniref:AAA family ATPase n=1 Tax=Vulgatibacter sp. TaxID=1971226 RepID=UPI003569222C